MTLPLTAPPLRYIGTTRQSPIAKESHAWITPRNYSDPVLMWAPKVPSSAPSYITIGEARSKLGFREELLHDSLDMLNITRIEELMQQRYHHYGLPRRLHRLPGAGSSGTDVDPSDLYIYSLFCTYSFEALQAVGIGNVLVIHRQPRGIS